MQVCCLKFSPSLLQVCSLIFRLRVVLVVDANFVLVKVTEHL